MISKILLKPLTLYVFFIGYGLTSIVMLIMQRTILHIFWIAFVGGVAFCLLWLVCIKLFTILLTEKELAHIFNIPTNNSNTYDEFDNDDTPLTLDELYNNSEENLYTNSSNSDNTNFTSLTQELNTTPDIEHDDLLDDFHSEVLPPKPSQQMYTLDQDGHFQMTNKGKALKVTPKDGAKAIQKVLNDDK